MMYRKLARLASQVLGLAGCRAQSSPMVAARPQPTLGGIPEFGAESVEDYPEEILNESRSGTTFDDGCATPSTMEMMELKADISTLQDALEAESTRAELLRKLLEKQLMHKDRVENAMHSLLLREQDLRQENNVMRRAFSQGNSLINIANRISSEIQDTKAMLEYQLRRPEHAPLSRHLSGACANSRREFLTPR